MESGEKPGESVTVKPRADGDESDTWEQAVPLPEPEARKTDAHCASALGVPFCGTSFLLEERTWFILWARAPGRRIC